MENTGKNDACVFYIPSVPMTPNNAVCKVYFLMLWCSSTEPLQQYVAQQRDAFAAGIPPPDFPGGLGESQFADATYLTEIQSEVGKQAMGLTPIPIDGKDEKRAKLAQEVNTILGF